MSDNTTYSLVAVGWQRVLLILFPFLIVTGFFEFIGALVINAPLAHNAQVSSTEMLVVTFFGMIGTVLLVLIFLRFVDNEHIEAIGINNRFSKSELLYSGLIVTLSIGISFLLLLMLGQIKFQRFHFQLIPFVQSFALFIIAAFSEEIFLRGYVLKNLAQSFSNEMALILSSCLFCALHFFNPNISLISIIDLFLAGMVLGIAYLYNQSLWLPLSIHFFWNFVQCHLGFMVSGQNIYSLISIDFSRNTIWNGGAFGFEGSVIAVVLELVAIVFLWRLFKRRKAPHLNNKKHIEK